MIDKFSLSLLAIVSEFLLVAVDAAAASRRRRVAVDAASRLSINYEREASGERKLPPWFVACGAHPRLPRSIIILAKGKTLAEEGVHR